jgi:hypothetical protein
MSIDVIVKCEVCDTEFSYIKVKPSKTINRTCSKKCSYELRKKTRHIVHDPIEKKCLDCDESFLDTSKKKFVDRCRKCVNEGMVKTRRAKGSYDRSEEQNEKLSVSLKRKYETGWNPNTSEHREKLSKGMKDRWADGSMREKSAETARKKYGYAHWTKTAVGRSLLSNRRLDSSKDPGPRSSNVSHWTQTEAGRKFLSKIRKGYKFSDSARRNMSIGAARRIRENNNHHERGKGGFREDLGHYVRSNWEANFARILRLQGKSYEYEPKSFQLAEGNTYTPDFLVDGVFYEIKGYWTEVAKHKLESFRKQFPDVVVQIIEGTEYDELRSQYRDKILWEGK